MKTTSWVIREKATGKVMFETFDKQKVGALNTAKYEAIPILEHLASLNSSRWRYCVIRIARRDTRPLGA